MSDPSRYNQPYYSQRPAPVQFNNHESKAPFDDIVDQYAAPLGRDAQHATFDLNELSSTHRRSFSKPANSAESTMKSGRESDETDRSYPPLVTKEVDTRTLWQKLLPDSLACRLYVLTVLIQTAIDLAIEGEILVRLNGSITSNETSPQKMPVYVSIFALAHVFQFVMALDAVRAKNTLQFIGLAIFNALFLVYAILQIFEIRSFAAGKSTTNEAVPIDHLTGVIPVVISVAELAYIALGWRIYNEFGWKVYKFLGADRGIKKMHANYQIFECLLKFNIFFWIGFSVQFIWLVLQKNDWEYYVTCAALPLSVILLIEGHLAAKHENRWMMYSFMTGCVGGMIYFIYKLVKVVLYRKDSQYSLVYKSLSTFSFIAILLLLATFSFSIMVLQGFGKGLKESLKRKNTSSHQRSGTIAHAHSNGPNPYRMSIN